MQRRLALPSGRIGLLVQAVGAESLSQGLLLSTTAFYMLRIVGLSATEVGLGLTIAVVIGVLVSVPVGFLADRTNPVMLAVLLTALRAVPVLGYTLVDSLATYLVATTLYATAYSGARVAGGAMIPAVFPSDQRVRARSAARVTTNLGITGSVGIGAAAVAIGSASAYRTLFVVAAGGLAVAAFMFHRLRRFQHTPSAAPSTEPVEAAPPVLRVAGRGRVFADRPYLAVTAITTLLGMNDALLVVALPLWISESTDAPPWIYSIALAVNTVGVAVLQMRLSRVAETTLGAARALRVSGVALALTCLLWGLAGQAVTAWIAVGLVLCGCFAHLVGEITASAGGWGLSYGLAPDDAHGQYQGVFETGQQIADAVVPLLAGTVLVTYGLLGWSFLGAVLLLGGLLAPLTVAWALCWAPRPGHAA